ncbi:XdhC family protein [Erwinia endophytica]|uniref:XdhC family protein n=1 Tax=Erwinia endophytica TaxID=1563158 RepID=UPI001265ECE5|nr:XdhC family protein [Erwinia endophytica]KAB8307935.1 XdhC family protein [Erwinia endophytica]
MLSLDQRVIDQALLWLRQGQTVWLCTVLHSWGSAPRSPGAMLAANTQGQWTGSLSGGCIEEDFLARLQQGAYPHPSERVRYGEKGLPPPVQLPCGGILDVLVERFTPQERALTLLASMQTALSGGPLLARYVTLGHDHQWQVLASGSPLPELRYDDNSVVLPLGAVTTVLIAGYSAVASECIRLALMLGFRVLVCEHRDAEFEQLRATRPDGENLYLIRQHPACYLEQSGASAATAILCLTHDPRIDDLTLMEAVNTPAFYIGAMGSAKNSQRRLQRLAERGGLSAPALARIHAPIGLAIGSKTPAEIALAALADIVRVRNGL